MKVKLKLDRDELKGFITILKIIEHTPGKNDLARYLFSCEAGRMKQNLTNRMIFNVNKKTFEITLTDYQTVVVFGLFRIYSFDLMPFEKAISLRVIAEIDKQFQNYLQVMQNFDKIEIC